MNNIFTVDGKAYNVNITKLTRKASVTDTSNSGRVISGDMVRDIIGTYYNYTLEIALAGSDVASYDELFDVVTAPEDSHAITVPYGQETLSFQAYITSAEDSLKIQDGKNMWGFEGMQLNFIAMSPQRR